MKFLKVVPVLLLLAACAPSPSREQAPLTEAFTADAIAPGAPAPKRAAEPTPQPSGAPEAPYEAKKQIKQGSVVLEANDPEAVEKALEAKLGSVGGFMETVVATEGTRSLTVRIPAAAFDTFLEGLTAWGKLTQRQVTVTDVSTQYYDLETRLKNQRLLLDQYRGFMAQTKKMDEILDVMARISDLTTQIESTEGQFRYLSRQVDFSTLSVEITTPLRATGRGWPDWDAGFSDLVHNVVDFLVGSVFFLLNALVVVPVVVGLIVLVLWLLIGRPGLWRRLVSLRHRPKPGFEPPKQ